MRVLAPIDGSKCSFRALAFATEFTSRFEGSLHVIHITDYEGEAKQDLLDRAKSMLTKAGIEGDPEIIPITQMASPRYANRVGSLILDVAAERDYDHVIMGHHGTGRLGQAFLGSAAKTVVGADEIPVTIIP
ncbi:universal stress protein [Halorubrum sp. AD140]|uniref:universal stress protein n=1 Tax=Halorubrum sp. AD140 TaxID=3050073 RepID=UPI002ACC3BF4|nr:universal stress protein [Halorubrum sp. AD140]MDZ5811695.1 universal stress protein [Halorubrum sp. AD140]